MDQAPGNHPAPVVGTQAELDAIRALVKRFGHGTWDVDELVSNIWWECWTKKKAVSVVMVKRRIWDRYKKTKRRLEILRSIARPEPETEANGPDPGEVVRRLLAAAQVRGLEKQVVWMRFVDGMEVVEIARELRVEGRVVKQMLAEVVARIKLAKGEVDAIERETD